jgi:hypothetical protein
MILKRKQTSPSITDSFGVVHPNLIIGFYAVPEDKLNRWIEIRCGYFHNIQTYQSRKDKFLTDDESGICSFTMRFDQVGIPAVYENGELVKLGYPTYDELKQSIEVESTGELTILADDVIYWILNQQFTKDFQGVVFKENWEVDLNV